MNKLYDVKIHVRNRTKFTEALNLIENCTSDVILNTITEKEFADSIAEDIRSLNDDYINGVEITLTCMEDLPYKIFTYNENSTIIFDSDNMFEDMRIFGKFCWNVIDKDLFIELMMPRYNDRDYIEGKWESFKRDSLMFIIGRDERELYRKILKKIKDTGYNG